jgi:hypothetical protein
MTRTDKEELEYALEILKEWKEGDEIVEVNAAFSMMASCDQTNHQDLWEKLRKALRENEDLNQDYMTKQLRIESLAQKNLWWYDPEQW